MCKLIRIRGNTAIICGSENNHICNEDAIVYETDGGQRFFFNSTNEAEKWFDDNYKNIIMGSVACYICGSTAFDNTRKY